VDARRLGNGRSRTVFRFENGPRGVTLRPRRCHAGNRRGGRNARLGVGTHHRAAGSPVDRRRLRTPIVTTRAQQAFEAAARAAALNSSVRAMRERPGRVEDQTSARISSVSGLSPSGSGTTTGPADAPSGAHRADCVERHRQAVDAAHSPRGTASPYSRSLHDVAQRRSVFDVAVGEVKKQHGTHESHHATRPPGCRSSNRRPA
jgi:hypothetical protein